MPFPFVLRDNPTLLQEIIITIMNILGIVAVYPSNFLRGGHGNEECPAFKPTGKRCVGCGIGSYIAVALWKKFSFLKLSILYLSERTY